jgi:hypothetical protein
MGGGLETNQSCVEMVEFESKVSGTTQENEAAKIDDRVVGMITAPMPQDDQGDEEEGSIHA